MIFFSAHGVPVSYVENAGDPYKDEMEECIYLIMQELKGRGVGNEHTLAYQVSNRFGAWLGFLSFSCFLDFHFCLCITCSEPRWTCTMAKAIH